MHSTVLLVQRRVMDYTNPYLYQPRNYTVNPYPQNTPSQNGGNIIWVQGEAAAKSWYVNPGSTVVLWDSEEQVIYIKSADNSGMPTIRVLDYTERGAGYTKSVDNPNYIVKADLEDIYAQLKDLRDDLDGLSIKKSTKKKEVEE